MRPVCCNHGCESLVTKNRNGKWTAFCGPCTKSNSTGDYKYGVLPIKIGRCSNEDGFLGFPCPVDWIKVEKSDFRYKKLLELDHLDGDHTNNSLSNLAPLCPICHATKGSLFNDQNAWKNKWRNYSS